MDHVDDDSSTGMKNEDLQLEDTENDINAGSVIGPGDCRNIKLGSKCPPTTLVDVEQKERSDRSFARFRKKLCNFLNHSLNSYGFNIQSMISLPTNFNVGSRIHALSKFEIDN